MKTSAIQNDTIRPAHEWLRRVNVAFIPGISTPLLEQVVDNLIQHFRQKGHSIQDRPDNNTDVILTTAPFGVPIRWREAVMFTARARYKLDRLPLIFTLVQATPEELKEKLDYFSRVLKKEPPDPEDFIFEGLTSQAYLTLYEQGRRGGPILALVRLLQSQTMSIRILLVVGEDKPIEAYTFDLVGAFPRTYAEPPQAFYEDLMLRIVTAASTRELSSHVTLDDPIPYALWQSLKTPEAMRRAGKELGLRNFFTEMVRIANLVHVPAINEAVASQYSEGCFATWEPRLGALISTITGSARPVDKGNLTDDELAVIVGLRPDYLGAMARPVEGKRNDPPSSEAVELMDMDSQLPFISLDPEWEIQSRVPVVRSKLHGHRGVRTYDPARVEHVSLDEPYYHYPVSCSTEAQAQAIKAAFSRSIALQNPDDPRQIVFTVLPGHGVVIAEKWVYGKQPFQLMWEYMDAGYLTVESHVPQGPLEYVPGEDGYLVCWEMRP